MSSRDPEVTVVGGGPAGCAAAVWLRRAGLTVALVDRAHFPRDKICGDGLTAAALREVERLGVDVRSRACEVRRVELTGPYGTKACLPLRARSGTRAVMAAVMPRLELDAALLGAAGDAGARIHTGSPVTTVAMAPDGVRVATADATVLQSDYVVAADGAYSTVRRALGRVTGPRHSGIHALRQYVDAPGSDVLSVIFPSNLLPGYGWVFPLPGGGANIGIGIHRDPDLLGVEAAALLTNDRGRITARPAGRLFRDFVARADVRDLLGGEYRPRGRVWAWPIPVHVDLGEVADRRVLFCGDAAGATDPMTGEGIGQALLSGRLAAEAIVAHRRAGPGAVAGAYREAIARDLARDLAFSRTLARLLRHRRGSEWALKAANLNDWTRRNFGRWMFEDYPRAVLGTPRRWRDQTLMGRGAYASRERQARRPRPRTPGAAT